MNDGLQLDAQGVLRQLPHRYPFLLVDRVLECVPGDSITALKNVTLNEPFFTGHFPGSPVMPGVLIIEALAQATGVLVYLTRKTTPADEIFYLTGVTKMRFKRPVLPGDQLILKAKLERNLRHVWRFSGQAEVDGRIVAQGELMAARGQ